MSNIRESIQEKQAERKLNILKGFSDFEETFEKAKTGKYSDNSVNRKLNRVGQEYGSAKKEDVKSDNKQSKKEDGKSDPSGHYTKEERDALNKLEEHAASTSTEDLKSFLKKYGNDSTKIDEVEAARLELEDRGENPDYDTEVSDENISKEVSFAIKQEFGDIGEKTCHLDDLKGILDEYDFEYQGEKISSKDLDKVVKILENQGWSIEGNLKNKSEDKKSPISVNEDGKKILENQKKSEDEDEDNLLESLGEMAFNSQGKFNKEKFKETYDKLLEIGLTDKYIEKKVGEMSWNHPDTPDDEMKTDWDDIIYEMNHSKNLSSKLDKVTKSVENLKKHLTSKE